MNIILTSVCNKGCTYCFARESMTKMMATEDSYMSLQTFEEILEKHNNPSIKLLGGEPTMHPEFEQILEICHQKDKQTTLISNFLFDDKKLESILKHLNTTINSFLINSTDLDVGNRIEKFKRNYNIIYQTLYKDDREDIISCGITLDHNKDEKYYIEYIDLLRDNLINIERMRVSLNFPGDSDKKSDFYFLNNHKIGDLYLSIVKYLVDCGIEPGCDCIVFPCMFENKEYFKYVKKFVSRVKTKCVSINSGSPMDVFIDGSASFCYPLRETIKLNFKNYLNSQQLHEDLTIRYKAIQQINTGNLPEECKICHHYNKSCDGPCLGFLNLETESIGSDYK